MAAAIKKVPASIRSGMTGCTAPRRSSTPSMVMVSLPAPVIRAPMAFRRFARSSISGSWATLRSTVRPRARVAAIITFSVPVTVRESNVISAPRRFFPEARM